MHDLVVVGAGPYGLSIAAHAVAAGLDVRVFGRPMASWRDHMPSGMFLKSEPWASDLSDPEGAGTLAAYCAARGLSAAHGRPLPIETFTAYGLWFAGQLPVPVEEREVTTVVRQPDGFLVRAGAGDPVRARNVALAVGVLPFVHVPRQLAELCEAGLAGHSSAHGDLAPFEDRDVAVLGAGQAALETAALLAEGGARPVLLARAGSLRWNTPPRPLPRNAWTRAATLHAPVSALGRGWPSWVWSELPAAVRRLPPGARAHIASNALGPAGAWWLRERVEGVVPVRLGHRLLSAGPTRDGRARLQFETAGGGRGAVIEADHVIAATGFVPDLERLAGLLGPALTAGLRTVPGTGAPLLSASFESSWPGLYLAGLPSAPCFGPAMRFVHGAGFTAERLVRGLRRRLRMPPGARPAPVQRAPLPSPAPRPAGAARPARPARPAGSAPRAHAVDS
ncbi:NAD(P)-binding domain-containing protein [Streptomyces sp. DSM 44917]|uniref:L-lysine N6-monooxygenase MbtG n=1 Tax=Streptomyces boetiae TaxID=3075541 RepID=A0ABU2L7A7_9ACTN|nr:NAD(P)-binding domain-containing protein [Streptomyces sp. DSM 44917]MDT0307088.1 NAD(P)-binding domain-containing protein [Streptomyces sp. DSM 44917]